MKTTCFTFHKVALICCLSFGLLSVQNLKAQKKKDKDKDKKEAEKPKDNGAAKDAPKKISDLVKTCSKTEGLFSFYRDSTTGVTHLLIKEEQLNKEYIYFSQFSNGVLEAWSFRGAYASTMVFKIQKHYNKIEFVFQNTTSYFDPKNPISRAADANMSNSTLASLKIIAQNDGKNEFLVDADQLFLRELFLQVKPPMFPGQGPEDFTLGELDKDKTKILNIRSYAANSDLEVEYSYTKNNTLAWGSRAIADGRYVSVKVYHSLIEMPQNDYQPLYDDPRIGYFTEEVSDMTTLNTINYRDLVHRWHLKKKDPNAAVSEPVEPITWWIENTTPLEIRPIIKKAGEQWNLAFEKAGFKNAVVIKEQPDNADWDAGDIRYNVLRWTSSPFLPFGGYGPSFVNPRTGQILGADIMLEYFTLANSLRSEKLMGTEASVYPRFPELPHRHKSFTYCEAGEYAHENQVFANLALKAMGGSKLEESKMVEEFLYYLILHEMGHTLGLNHNMKSSQLHSIKDIHNMEITGKMGLTGSVMDYPMVNFSNDRSKQGHYFTKVPGTYDMWAIQWAYTPGIGDAERKKMLDRSTEPALMFGNDADDMRWPGKAIDPRVNVNDLSSEAIAYSVGRIDLCKKVSGEVMKKFGEEGKSYQEHAVAYAILTNAQGGCGATISRYVGGVYVDRAMVGQAGATKPLQPVEAEKQKQAMDALAKYIFAPDAFQLDQQTLNYLQIQRRGFNFFGFTEDPKLHRRVLFYQRDVLEHLLHPSTTQRLVDSKLYGNGYGIEQMMSDLTNAIFKADIAGSVNSFRQNLQTEYTRSLINIISGPQNTQYLHTVKANVVYQLKEIKKMCAAPGGDLSTQAHKDYLNTIITNTLRELH